MTIKHIRRSTDTRPVPQGLLSPRDVYDFAKVRADALRAEMVRTYQQQPLAQHLDCDA